MGGQVPLGQHLKDFEHSMQMMLFREWLFASSSDRTASGSDWFLRRHFDSFGKGTNHGRQLFLGHALRTLACADDFGLFYIIFHL